MDVSLPSSTCTSSCWTCSIHSLLSELPTASPASLSLPLRLYTARADESMGNKWSLLSTRASILQAGVFSLFLSEAVLEGLMLSPCFAVPGESVAMLLAIFGPIPDVKIRVRNYNRQRILMPRIKMFMWRKERWTMLTYWITIFDT